MAVKSMCVPLGYVGRSPAENTGRTLLLSPENSRTRLRQRHDFHGRWLRCSAGTPRLEIGAADAPDPAIFPAGWSGLSRATLLDGCDARCVAHRPVNQAGRLRRYDLLL